MSKEITFELFQESDAQQVADLMNRNRFQAAKSKHLTAQDYLFIRQSRGEHFLVIAKKNGKAIGILGTYPTSIQHVARKHQVFVGNFLVDMQYRLSYSVIMGLYDVLITELTKGNYKEILATILPENEGSYYLMIKCGFVLLSNKVDDFGRMTLRNYSPALSLYAGKDSTQVSSNTFFSMLPIVDKKIARKKQEKLRLHDQYIECDYMLDGKEATLLYDIVNLKVNGGVIPKVIKVYPDFQTQGIYKIENLSRSKPLRITVEMVMEPESKQENVLHEITLEPKESKRITCSKEVSELNLLHGEKWYRLHPNLLMEEDILKKPLSFESERLKFTLEPSTGFVNFLEGEDKLATLVWPCATFPYLEGVNTPRIKDLKIEELDKGVIITEETDEYKLSRRCDWLERKMEVTTFLQCKMEGVNVRPLSQIYAGKGVMGYGLGSKDKELTFDSSKIQHKGFGYGDFTYLDTEPEYLRNFPIESISLNYPTSTLEFTLDKRSKSIVHAPIFTSNLFFDKEKLLEEQVIEKMEVYYRTEDE